MAHVLDRPVWTTLRSKHSGIALGDDHARRFPLTIGPLGSARDDGADSLASLASLVRTHGKLILLQADRVVVPKGLTARLEAGVQMVADSFSMPELAAHSIERLGPQDADEMLALATLTKPGPFAEKTAELGEFWGVREGGTLIAMAGERMKQEGFTEVSGVCTHPEVRGRGLARALSATVAARIVTRGETPYLHAYANNTAAIALYETLGFRLRTMMHVATLELRELDE